MTITSLVAALLLLAPFPTLPAPAAAQEPASPAQDVDEGPSTAAVIAAANPEARVRWERLVAASRGNQVTEGPITAFVLRADVLIREGVKRNEAKVDYQFLAPHYIRFMLPSKRETGRGPGVGQSGYWLKDGEQVIYLAGRENREDRRMVDEMVAIARNFIALSDPARLALTRLELMAAPPTGLPKAMERMARKNVDWIRVASKDFGLLADHVELEPDGPRDFLVDLGIDRGNDLPLFAIIREAKGRTKDGVALPANPMLVHLGNWERRNGFQVPRAIRVHRLDPGHGNAAFAELAAQDIVVLEANLRPALTPEDFAPK